MIRDLLWERRDPLLFITREQFDKELDGWDIQPVEMDGQIAFATLRKGPQFHFQSFGTGHLISRKMIRDYLTPIIAEHGFAATHTPIEDARQHRFNLLMGFTVTGEDHFDRHYQIERLP